MPTPFTHLARANQLLNDPDVSPNIKRLLETYWDAFLLGSITPDAHHKTKNLKREDTHFFVYEPKINPLAEDIILDTYPQLRFEILGPSAYAVFMAGYLGHIGMDEAWCEQVVMPIIAHADWGDPIRRHFVFVLIMSVMDARDYQVLPEAYYGQLSAAQPDGWLPFLPDAAVRDWRDVVAQQIGPGGHSETLDILGRTTRLGNDALARVFHSPDELQRELWDRYSPDEMARAERIAYEHMRRVVSMYLGED